MVSYRGTRAARARGLSRRAAGRASRDRRASSRAARAPSGAPRSGRSCRSRRRRRRATPSRRERTRPEDEPHRRRSSPSGTRATTPSISAARSKSVPVRVSRRMKSRLGHYTRGAHGEQRRDRDQLAASAPPWLGRGAAHAAARDGASVAGRDRPADRPRRAFRAKAREVGIAAAARARTEARRSHAPS